MTGFELMRWVKPRGGVITDGVACRDVGKGRELGAEALGW